MSRVSAPLLLIAALTVAGGALAAAYVLQYGFGMEPCPLCHRQRIPYFVGLPLGVAALAFAPVRRLAAAGAALAFVVGVALAVQHVGVEHAWWAGPQACSGRSLDVGFDPAAALQTLQQPQTPSCAETTPFLGLSLATWNVGVSAAAAALFVAALFAAAGRR